MRLINRRNTVKYFAARGLLLSFQNDVGIGNRAEGEYVVPHPPGRAYAHRVYRKSGFVSGRGKKLMSATCVQWANNRALRVPSSDFFRDVQIEKRNGFLKIENCDIGSLLLFVGGFDKYREDNARPVR